MHHFTSIAKEFHTQGRIVQVKEFGNGNINDTYLVTTDSNEDNHFVMQRINTHVFREPRLIMQNMRIFTEHIHKRTRKEGHRWEMPRVIAAQDGQDFHIDRDGNFWRAISFVYGAQSFDVIKDVNHAREVGRALALSRVSSAICPLTNWQTLSKVFM